MKIRISVSAVKNLGETSLKKFLQKENIKFKRVPEGRGCTWNFSPNLPEPQQQAILKFLTDSVPWGLGLKRDKTNKNEYSKELGINSPYGGSFSVTLKPGGQLYTYSTNGY